MKRWDIYFCSDDSDLLDDVAIEVDEEVRAARDGERRIEVMPVEDHERIVAELKHALEVERRGHQKRWDQLESADQTIATQKRVIAVLGECIAKEDYRCGNWPEGRKALALAVSIEKGEA